jgi:hypothetical protein
METFKLSCPRCGQHIEYTKDYCGRQVQCPSCAGSVTFPALPPGALTQKLRLERDRPKVKQPFRLDFGKILASTISFVRNFQHWQIVLMCLLPFGFIVVALGIASVVRHQDQQPNSEQPVVAETRKTETQQVDAMLKADAIVRSRVQSILAAKSRLDNAVARRSQLRAMYSGRNPSAAARTVMANADEQVEAAEANLNGWKKSFDIDYANYEKAGGKIDYRSQLPR